NWEPVRVPLSMFLARVLTTLRQTAVTVSRGQSARLSISVSSFTGTETDVVYELWPPVPGLSMDPKTLHIAGTPLDDALNITVSANAGLGQYSVNIVESAFSDKQRDSLTAVTFTIIDPVLMPRVIDAKYAALGGAQGVLGPPAGNESFCSDLTGQFREYQRGVIYWSPSTDAHEVHGAILQKWHQLSRELGALGYPVTDETPTPDGRGRYN